MVGMKTPILALALTLVLTTGLPSANADDEQAFINARDSFRAAFGLVAGLPVTVDDRLAAVRGVATFGHEKSTELLMLAVTLEYQRIDRLLAKRDALRALRPDAAEDPGVVQLEQPQSTSER